MKSLQTGVSSSDMRITAAAMPRQMPPPSPSFVTCEWSRLTQGMGWRSLPSKLYQRLKQRQSGGPPFCMRSVIAAVQSAKTSTVISTGIFSVTLCCFEGNGKLAGLVSTGAMYRRTTQSHQKSPPHYSHGAKVRDAWFGKGHDIAD